MKLFEMKHIKKSFGALDVLRDISLEVDKGETAAKSSKTEKSDWFFRILTFFPIFP